MKLSVLLKLISSNIFNVFRFDFFPTDCKDCTHYGKTSCSSSSCPRLIVFPFSVFCEMDLDNLINYDEVIGLKTENGFSFPSIFSAIFELQVKFNIIKFKELRNGMRIIW